MAQTHAPLKLNQSGTTTCETLFGDLQDTPCNHAQRRGNGTTRGMPEWHRHMPHWAGTYQGPEP